MSTPKYLLVFTIALLSLAAYAQDDGSGDSPIIHFKQRFLKKKSAPDKPEAGEDSTRTLHLMIAGNIYQTERHADYAFDNKTGKYNFRNELKYIQPILGLGDITIANLKTSFGGDVKNMYSSPDEFALAVKYSGINAVMHANLHTANVDKSTLQRTRDMLYDFGMFHTGAFSDNFQRTGNYPLIINKKGFRIAILNYGSINKRPSISRDFIINEIDKGTIERDLRMARANKPDFTIVYLDWGSNSQDIPSYSQMDIAQFCFQNGANMVVGTHPNTPMRLDYMSYSSNGTQKEGIVAYSLGNLISSNEEIKNRNGYVIDMEITKNNYTGDVNLGDWGVIPVYTYYDTNSVSGKISVYSLACSAVENGDILKDLPYIEKRRVVNSAYEVRKLLGSTADEIQYNMTDLVCNNVMETIDLTNAALNNKYNQTRQENIAPSEAPSLPVAVSGSNNPPSLATIYDDVKPVNKPGLIPTNPVASNKPVTAYDQQKQKAEQTFVSPEKSAGGTLPATGGNNSIGPSKAGGSAPATGSNASPSSPGTTTASNPSAPANGDKPTAQTDAAPTSAATTGGATAPNNNSTPSATTNANDNSGAKSNSGAIDDPAKTTAKNNTVVADDDPAKKKTTTTITDDGGGAKKTAAPVLEDDPASKSKTVATAGDDDPAKKKTTTTADGDDPKGKSANTNYHTEGNKYEVATPTYGTQPGKAKAVQPEGNKAGPDVASGTQGSGAINTKGKLELGEEMKKLDEKTMHVVTDTFYRIQFYALKKYIPLDTNYYTHLKGYEVYEEDSLYKYLLGRYKDYSECESYWKSQILPRYKTSFIVKYIDGKRMLDK